MLGRFVSPRFIRHWPRMNSWIWSKEAKAFTLSHSHSTIWWRDGNTQETGVTQVEAHRGAAASIYYKWPTLLQPYIQLHTFDLYLDSSNQIIQISQPQRMKVKNSFPAARFSAVWRNMSLNPDTLTIIITRRGTERRRRRSVGGGPNLRSVLLKLHTAENKAEKMLTSSLY